MYKIIDEAETASEARHLAREYEIYDTENGKYPEPTFLLGTCVLPTIDDDGDTVPDLSDIAVITALGFDTEKTKVITADGDDKSFYIKFNVNGEVLGRFLISKQPQPGKDWAIQIVENLCVNCAQPSAGDFCCPACRYEHYD